MQKNQSGLGLSELLYLGHIISAQGVHMDPEKIRVIIEWPTPVNLTQLRGFLGLVGSIGGLLVDIPGMQHP